MAVGVNAQTLIAEKDWTGGFEGDYPMWAQFAEGQEGSVVSDAEGVAITVGTQTGELWQPQVTVLNEGLTLMEDCSYLVRILAKFPGNGTLQINMGNWDGRDQYTTEVEATGDFQWVEVGFPDYAYNVDGNGFVLFQCGGFAGTTIVKKVEVLELPYRSDSFGPNVFYYYYPTSRKLTISGKGPMVDWHVDTDDLPWKDREDPILFDYLEIEEGVTSVGDFTFPRSGLTSVSLPNSLTSIGIYAFHINRLTSVTLPANLTSIGRYAFADGNLTTIISKIKNPFSIDKSVFSGIPSDAKLIVPKGTRDKYKATNGWKNFKNIVEATDGEDADFTIDGISYRISTDDDSKLEVVSVDKGMKKVEIPELVTYNKGTYFVGSIGDGAFQDNSAIETVVLPNSITSIGQFAFGACSSLKTITIPKSVTEIGEAAFYGCSSLESIGIPSGIKKLGNSLFWGCARLTDVTIPESVTTIGEETFRECMTLASITLPKNVKEIGQFAFQSCPKLTDVFCYAENVPKTDDTAFDGTPTETATLHVPASAVEAYRTTWPWSDFKEVVDLDPGDGPTLKGKCGVSVNYSYDKATKTLTVSGTGETFDYGFESNKAPWSSYADEIQKIEIGFGITSIGHFNFYKCSSITSLNVPATVGYIGSSAFEDCTSLTSLSLNDGLLYIGGSAFESCSELQELTIPSTVKTISINAFKNCKGITDVYCYAENVPDTHFDAFDATPTGSSTLHVPASAVEAYRAAWPWSDFKSIVAISSTPDEVEFTLDGITYKGLSSGMAEVTGASQETSSLTIPESVDFNGTTYRVTSIVDGAFQKNSAIETVVLPSSITSIGQFAFGACTNLKIIVIPNSVTEIGDAAFYGCSSLVSIIIPDKIKRLGDNLFWGCAKLTDVTIPESVTTIGAETFRECLTLASLTLPSSIKEIGRYAFQSCLKLTDVYCYAETVPMTDDDAFDGSPTGTATLHVPANAVEDYWAAWPWGDFFKEVVALDPDGIVGVKQSDDSNCQYYDLTGRKVSHPQKGIYIRNGKKVVVK